MFTLRSFLGVLLLQIGLLPFVTVAQPPASESFPDIDSVEAFNALSEAEQEAYLQSLQPTTPLPALPTSPAEAIDCFDYYTFGSVQVDLSATLQQTVPGVPMTFSGTVTNNNPYPVVDGQIYVKLFKRDSVDSALAHQNGYPLVDFFLVADDVNLLANASQPLSFDWLVPQNAPGGEYEAAFYFTTAKRFNLLGLTFTDDVAGNKAMFTVTSDQTPVTFDKHSVYLNDTDYRFAAYPPHFGFDEPVQLSVDVVNPTTQKRVVEIEWVTSNWDALLPEREVLRQSRGLVLEPNERKTISYTPPHTQESVTFVQGIVKDRESLSIIHPRFVRDGVPEVRINFPSITSFPLVADETTEVFSCLHSTNLPLVENMTLALTLADDEGEVIHSYTYQGDVTSAMMGVAEAFTPSEDHHRFSLTATLMQEGHLVEEVVIEYRCEDLDPENCPDRSPLAVVSDILESEATTPLLGAVVLLVLIALIVLVVQKRRRTDNIVVEAPDFRGKTTDL